MKNNESIVEVDAVYESVGREEVKVWIEAAPISSFPINGGGCILYKGLQIAIYNFTHRAEWYAVQNLCPHKHQMILSRGMIGTQGEMPKVACPYHKKTFSLKTGENLNDNLCSLATYPVKVENDIVYVGFKA